MRCLGLWWPMHCPGCQCTRQERDVKYGSTSLFALGLLSEPSEYRLLKLHWLLVCELSSYETLVNTTLCLVAFWEGAWLSFLDGALKLHKCLTELQWVWFSSWDWGPWWRGDCFNGNVQPLGHRCCSTRTKQEKTRVSLSLAADRTTSCRLQRPSLRISELKSWLWAIKQPPPTPFPSNSHLLLLPSRILMLFQFLFLAHTKEKEKELIIIYKRSSFQTNGEAFNADIYFSPLLNGIYLNADFLVSCVELGRSAFQFKC